MGNKIFTYLILSYLFSQFVYAELHFGVPSAVKKKTKELKDKIEQEKIAKNNPPVIVSLTAEPPVVATGAVTTITCIAEDPDNEALTYSWDAPYGAITGSGYSVSWTASTYYTPPTGTYYPIFCTVYDTKGASATAKVDVLVTPDGRINRTPIIEALTAEPLSVSTGGVVTIVCTAYDLDDDEITYFWHTTTGTLLIYTSSAILTAPDFPTNVTVFCTVKDNRGAETSESVYINVYPVVPVISSLLASPIVVSTGATSTIVCNAYGPASDTLTYSWDITAGTITGYGYYVKWVAPSSTGVYTITCTVSDSKNNTAQKSIDITVIIPWVLISCGLDYTVGIKSDGTLWSWGRNNFGQLGIGNTEHMLTPTQVGTDTDWAYVACGYYHTVAIKKNGTLWAWGRNDYGQLGLGNDINIYTPTQVGTDTNWSYVSCGAFHTVAIKKDGTLWSWGFNNQGQLGLRHNTNRNTPTSVGTERNWSFVSCGAYYTVAIKTDGTLWSWGANDHGQLGLGHNISTNTPTQVGTDTNWSYVSCGSIHTIAIKTDTTLWSWGFNYYGQLGLGHNIDISTPTQITTANADKLWERISCGFEYSVGIIKILNDGTLWSWGRNYFGQLGLGNKNDTNIPLRVDHGIDWFYVSCGYSHTAAIQEDGTLWCWGANNYGQLGLGDTTERLTPTLVYK